MRLSQRETESPRFDDSLFFAGANTLLLQLMIMKWNIGDIELLSHPRESDFDITEGECKLMSRASRRPEATLFFAGANTLLHMFSFI